MSEQVSLSAFERLNDRLTDALVRVKELEQRERDLVAAGDAMSRYLAQGLLMREGKRLVGIWRHLNGWHAAAHVKDEAPPGLTDNP